MAERKKDDRNIYQRLLAVQKNVRHVAKVKPDGLKYAVVTHDDVTHAVRTALTEEGVYYFANTIAYEQNGNRTECMVEVTFINADNPGDTFKVQHPGYGIDNQDKGPGKAISYATKYCLLKALALETGDDPDLDQKSEHEADPEEAYAEKERKQLNDIIKEEIKALKWKPEIAKEALKAQFDGRSASELSIPELSEAIQFLRHEQAKKSELEKSLLGKDAANG